MKTELFGEHIVKCKLKFVLKIVAFFKPLLYLDVTAAGMIR